MGLPDASSVPQGSIWTHKGTLFVCVQNTSSGSNTSKWVKTDAIEIQNMRLPTIDVDFPCEYIKPQVLQRLPSPFQRRGRGRPTKAKKTTKSENERQPSAYNLYIQQQMLTGAFSHLQGQARFREIAKGYTDNCLIAWLHDYLYFLYCPTRSQLIDVQYTKCSNCDPIAIGHFYIEQNYSTFTKKWHSQYKASPYLF